MSESIATRVAIDAMGGDHAPFEIVKGCVLALSNNKIHIVLVGDEKAVKKELSKYTYDESRLEIVNATQVIETDETPTLAIKQKKDSSMTVGLTLLKEKKADAFVSAGSTGALLTGATLIVGRIKGVERPALGTLLPNKAGFSFLIDCGANVDSKPNYLAQFGKMGSVYMETVQGIVNPRVGLLNIGAEKEKGNALAKEAYGLLDNAGLYFTGNVEAREIPMGAVDVVVCDGFTGNVLLKYTEGFAKTMLGIVKEELMATTMSKIGAFLAKGAFGNLKNRFDYNDIGGAPFLGLNGLVVKAHGNSDASAIKGAILQCVAYVENEFVMKLEEKL